MHDWWWFVLLGTTSGLELSTTTTSLWEAHLRNWVPYVTWNQRNRPASRNKAMETADDGRLKEEGKYHFQPIEGPTMEYQKQPKKVTISGPKKE